MHLYAISPDHHAELDVTRRAEVLARARARGCTCSRPDVHLTLTAEHVDHRDGCPAATVYLEATFA